MKICYFGSFDPDYTRNKIIIKGLEQNSCLVSICNDRSGEIKNYFRLAKEFIKAHRSYEVIMVGVLGHYDLPIAWVLAKIFRKKLIFDAFISLYDTYVFDRQTTPKFSLQATKFYFWDYLSCHLADLIFLDTQQHAKYFIHQFHLKKEKVKVVYIGADNTILRPQSNQKNKKFIVEFHGSFQPLQGVEYIIQAASLLKNEKKIKFILIGEGQTKAEIVRQTQRLKLKNVKFLPRQTIDQIATQINKSALCLGIFGQTPKAKRVIPNKLYEAIALKKAVITGKNQAVKEIFTDGKDVILVAGDSPQELANSLIALQANPQRLDQIANAAYNLFLRKLTVEKVGQRVYNIIKMINQK